MPELSPITRKGLRNLSWAGALIIAGILCTGAAWATGVERDLKDLADVKREIRMLREHLIRIGERLGVPAPSTEKED